MHKAILLLNIPHFGLSFLNLLFQQEPLSVQLCLSVCLHVHKRGYENILRWTLQKLAWYASFIHGNRIFRPFTIHNGETSVYLLPLRLSDSIFLLPQSVRC